jgi:hypothetical protein
MLLMMISITALFVPLPSLEESAMVHLVFTCVDFSQRRLLIYYNFILHGIVLRLVSNPPNLKNTVPVFISPQ